MFGALQFTAYAALIGKAIDLISENPLLPGSLDRSAIASGVRQFNLELAADRRGAASHHIYYLTLPSPNDPLETFILRVLHEKMEAGARIGRAVAAVRQRHSP